VHSAWLMTSPWSRIAPSCLLIAVQVRTGDRRKQVMPSDHAHVLCTYHQATPEVIGSVCNSVPFELPPFGFIARSMSLTSHRQLKAHWKRRFSGKRCLGSTAPPFSFGYHCLLLSHLFSSLSFSLSLSPEQYILSFSLFSISVCMTWIDRP
jgi:hypothetical protein